MKKKKTEEERKESKKLYNKEYRKKNSEKLKKNNIQWCKDNPDYHKNYRKVNADKCKERSDNWRKANPDKKKESDIKYRELNKDIILEKENKRRGTPENKAKRKELYKIRRESPENREKDLQRGKDWAKANPEKVRKNQNNLRKKYPERGALRDVLRNCQVRFNTKKEGDTVDVLGYSALELKNYMISLFTEGMSWDNHGEWHIDHIKPVSTFDRETPMNIVNALSNLQPLWATSRTINGVFYIGNINKGNKFNIS